MRWGFSEVSQQLTQNASTVTMLIHCSNRGPPFWMRVGVLISGVELYSVISMLLKLSMDFCSFRGVLSSAFDAYAIWSRIPRVYIAGRALAR